MSYIPTLIVKEMSLDQVNLRIDYFHDASADYLKKLGVEPSKLPTRKDWHRSFVQDAAQPIEKRQSFNLIWLLDDQPIGMSSVDQIKYADQAIMHLHVINPTLRRKGIGTAAIRKSVNIYFETLNLKRLFCQPNAFNTAPHRALQKAGFQFVETVEITPGPINFHQPVTRWKLERSQIYTPPFNI